MFIKSHHTKFAMKIKKRQLQNTISLTSSVERFEKDLIIEGLKINNGNQTKTAKYLDTSLRIINYKIHQFNIDPKKYKL